MDFEFDWDPEKARSNQRDHNVTFEEAATIFFDPLTQTVPDRDHSFEEERWNSIGFSRSERLLLVVHTHIEVGLDVISIRIISARKPTRSERRHYEQG